MLSRVLPGFALSSSGAAFFADIFDATSRGVRVQDRVRRILPAEPSDAVLPAAVATDLMLGSPMPLLPGARELLSPEASHLPQIPILQVMTT